MFPSAERRRRRFPTAKKDHLDASCPANYRPLSKLAFPRELPERVVQGRLQAFLNLCDAMGPKHQSVYCKHHSTETASQEVFKDLLLASDCSEVTTLVLLDSSSAFETIDHELLLHLEDNIGLLSAAKNWLSLYLSYRSCTDP